MTTTDAPVWRNRIVRSGDAALADIVPNEANWRTHPKLQADALSSVLAEVGYVQQVVINERSGRLVDGHLRVALATQHGEASVPAVWVDLDDDEERLILATLDPLGAMAETNRDALSSLLGGLARRNDGLGEMLAGLAKSAGLDGHGNPAEDPGVQIDRAEELRVKWGTERGQLWEIGRHRLLCGDSTSREDVAMLMGGAERATLLATDPPYNVGIEYGDDVDDEKVAAEYRRFSESWFLTWQAVSDRQIVTPGCNNLASWLRWFDAYHVAPWTKTNAMTNGKVARWWCWEPVLFFGAQWPRKRANDVFNHPVPPQKAEGMGSLSPFHPCPKPLSMWVDLLENYSDVDDIVGEAFSGSGTTLVAAEQIGRTCYAMEIEPKYVAVCLERLAGMGLAPGLL